MLLYRTADFPIVLRDGRYHAVADISWDSLAARDDLHAVLAQALAADRIVAAPREILAPVAPSQEVWAAGVTYWRSRTARMEESKDAGGGSFYDRVYNADRPELFFKSSHHRVVGSDEPIRIRSDSKWNVPEPELTLVVNSAGKIVGYTIGNDVSSRDIEGENPLYLPQAKVYSGSCALGPCILMQSEPLDPQTAIEMQIRRDGATIFQGSTTLSQMR